MITRRTTNLARVMALTHTKPVNANQLFCRGWARSGRSECMKALAAINEKSANSEDIWFLVLVPGWFRRRAFTPGKPALLEFAFRRLRG
jgi:hypothetical protein